MRKYCCSHSQTTSTAVALYESTGLSALHRSMLCVGTMQSIAVRPFMLDSALSFVQPPSLEHRGQERGSQEHLLKDVHLGRRQKVTEVLQQLAKAQLDACTAASSVLTLLPNIIATQPPHAPKLSRNRILPIVTNFERPL